MVLDLMTHLIGGKSMSRQGKWKKKQLLIEITHKILKKINEIQLFIIYCVTLKFFESLVFPKKQNPGQSLIKKINKYQTKRCCAPISSGMVSPHPLLHTWADLEWIPMPQLTRIAGTNWFLVKWSRTEELVTLSDQSQAAFPFHLKLCKT